MPRAARPTSVASDAFKLDTSGSSPEQPVITNRLSAETYSRALRAERVSSGKSSAYSTVIFWSRRNDALSTQRDEKMAGSCRSVPSVRAGARKFLTCSALLFVDQNNALQDKNFLGPAL